MSLSLFQRFLADAKDVPPSRLLALPILSEIRTASPALRAGVIDECIAAFPLGGTKPHELLGKYWKIALTDIVNPLVRDDDLPYVVDDVPRLLAGIHVLSTDGVVASIIRRDGWTDDLRDRVLACREARSLHDAAFDPMPRGEGDWSGLARADLRAMDERTADTWKALFARFAKNPAPFVPNEAWRTETAIVRAQIPVASWQACVPKWLGAVSAVSAGTFTESRPSGLTVRAEHNATLLHGLVAGLDEAELRDVEVQSLAHLARAAFAVTPASGAYLPKLGYRCLRVLARHPQIVADVTGARGAGVLPFNRCPPSRT